MKSYIIKMIFVVLIIGIIIIVPRKSNRKYATENLVINRVLYNSDISYNKYIEEKVYEDLTLEELGLKIDNVLNSTLDGYGELIASISLENNVDPIVSASIILVETGCKWSCSSLVKYSNNVGGMRGSNGYLKFSSLDAGIESFVKNLAINYYEQGLNTPELMNKKYATNPNWYQDVYYYVDLIKAS